MKSVIQTFLVILAVTLTPQVNAGVSESEYQAIKKALSVLKKDVVVTKKDIKSSALPNLYEVTFGARIFYVSKDGKYLLTGELFDVKNARNLTEDAKVAVRLNIMKKIDEKDMIGYLADLVHSQDEPIADWVCIPLYFVAKLAKDCGVSVVQVGEGSDEQFCGYSSYMTYLNLYRKFWNPYMRLMPEFLRWGIGAAASKLAAATPRFDKFVEVLRRAGDGHELFYSGANAFWSVHKDRLLTAPIRGGDWPELAEAGLCALGAANPDSGAVINAFLDPFKKDHPGSDDLARMTYAEFRLRLPELLLMRVDKISMSTSVEGRVPFLDQNLVEFTMDIPQAWKVRGGETKYLLKKALEDLLPKDIIYRKKMGFGAPMADWLRGAFGRRAERTVLNSSLFDLGLLDRDHVAGLFRGHFDGRKDNALHLWALFNLAAWYDHWIAGASSN